MTKGPNGTELGEVLQPPGETPRGVVYAVGKPMEYTSMYGYLKLLFPVHEVDTSTGELGQYVGDIKQEPMPDENGNLVGFAYYTKANWRGNGQLRFYPTPEALLAAFRMPVYAGEVTTPGDETVTDSGVSVVDVAHD